MKALIISTILLVLGITWRMPGHRAPQQQKVCLVVALEKVPRIRGWKITHVEAVGPVGTADASDKVAFDEIGIQGIGDSPISTQAVVVITRVAGQSIMFA